MKCIRNSVRKHFLRSMRAKFERESERERVRKKNKTLDVEIRELVEYITIIKRSSVGSAQIKAINMHRK